MGLSTSVPSAFALTVGETGRRLSLDRNQPLPDSSWARFEALDLDVVRDAPSRPANGHDGVIDHLKTRRLALRAAILGTDPARLQSGLRACVPDGSGFTELRVWFGAGAPWIGGRVTIGHRQAPFTIRLALEPRATGSRRLTLFLGDVRLYAPLPLPAPLVGSALARAIVAGCGGPSPRLAARDGGLDVAPLDLALVPALVAWGWRLPDLAPATLRAIATPDGSGGALHLIFGGDDVPRIESSESSESSASSGPTSWLEGARLPTELAAGERALFAGDVRAAEEAYRAHLTAHPEERAAQARLVALGAPAGTAVLEAGARALTQAWPEFLPGWLYAAIGAWQAGERETAAAWFTRASALAAARGEDEDARLAVEAAAAVRSGGPPLSTRAPDADSPAGAPAEAAALAGAIARALMAGDRVSADAAIAEHLDAHDDPARRGALYAEIAEAVLAAGGGAALALATVAEGSWAGSSARGLELRADLAERLGNTAEAARALGELVTRAVAAGEMTRARTLSGRQARLAAAPAPLAETAVPRPVESPDSGNITGRTEAVYATEKDTQARSGALNELLRDFDRLTPERRRAAYASFGRVAEATGDLERAEEAYWRGTHLDGQPDQRADFLIEHARLLLSRGNDRAAAAELDEALRLAPGAVRALAARADLAFRARDWPRAHELYAKLERTPGAAEVIARETLVHRRAVLARGAGDDDAAEAGFRELAILDPRQVEARLALADMAIQRKDRATGAQRLEEVLRLLPLDAMDAMLEVRERLGELYAGLGDWGAARYYQELILAQDGGRPAALEQLIDALIHLELFEEAAAACERLSRLRPEPAARAEALHRQGEILLERLHDEPRAFDAFLRSSDLAPAFVPTALRLMAGFWLRGRFGEVAEVAGELARTGALASAPLGVRVRAALAAAIARHEPAPLTLAGLDDAPEHPRELAQALAEAAQSLGPAPPAQLEPAIKLLTASGGSEARAALAALAGALAALLNGDPAAGGAALALGWLADRRGDQAAARPLYALATFLDGAEGVRTRLKELGPSPPVTTATMALAGGNDHPGVGATGAPLRRALGALAHGLSGFGPLATRHPLAHAGELTISSDRRETWYALAKTMAAPPLGLALAEPTATTPAGGGAEVTTLATRPGLVSIPPAMLTLPDDELTFSIARALDRLRSGLALVDAITTGDPKEVEALLRGAAAALAGRTPPDLPLATAAAAELASPDRAAALVGSAPRPRVAGDLLLAEEALVGWDGFRAAAALASDRFALLACRSPLAALRFVYQQHGGEESSSELSRELSSEPSRELSSSQARRSAFLRAPRLRELVAFMTSAAYADATRDASRG